MIQYVTHLLHVTLIQQISILMEKLIHVTVPQKSEKEVEFRGTPPSNYGVMLIQHIVQQSIFLIHIIPGTVQLSGKVYCSQGAHAYGGRPRTLSISDR